MEEKKVDERVVEEIQFMQVVSMFADSVMQHLGKISNPLTKKIERDLDAAKATIDILMMLKKRTKGNLNEREERFLADTLSNLQMNYVEELKKEEEKKEGEGTEKKEVDENKKDKVNRGG
ncbi:MAG: DUF1844 domain-containing protein [bacterium]|nr:DUF1844 domain-containing protein [bacterium]